MESVVTQSLLSRGNEGVMSPNCVLVRKKLRSLAKKIAFLVSRSDRWLVSEGQIASLVKVPGE
jgi:hypothetical protein